MNRFLAAREDGIPKKSTEWCVRVWRDWVNQRLSNLLQSEISSGHHLQEDLAGMSVESMNFWLSWFVLEVRWRDCKEYPPNSLYQICCGLM